MSQRREWSFGTHRAELEDPDLLVVIFEGPTTLEDAVAALKIYREACGATPRFVIINIERSSIDSIARKHLAEGIDPAWFRGVVYVGANLILKMVTKAISIMVLFNARQPYEVTYAEDEGEARAVIAAWRAKAQPGPSPA